MEENGGNAGGGRRERRRQETRERLFQSAMRLLSEHDYTDVTIEMITEAADVGKGTFFNYFLTKEAVISYRFERHCELLTIMLGQNQQSSAEHCSDHSFEKYFESPFNPAEEKMARKENRLLPLLLRQPMSIGGPVWERIVMTMHHVGDSDASSKRLTRNLLALGLVNDAVRTTCLNVHERVREIAEHLILTGQASGEIRDDLTSRILGDYLRGVYLSILYQWAESETEEDIHKVIDRTLPFVWSSIRHPDYITNT